ncbi:MAG: hypothetical protein AAGB22_10685 [Bacteroidota bacterium]
MLAGLCFLGWGLLIVRRLETHWWLPVYLLLVANPFMLDFFSLARGYGLALAFTLGSLHCLLDYVESRQLKPYAAALLLAVLAVLSSFATLYWWCALWLVFNLLHVTRAGRARGLTLRQWGLGNALHLATAALLGGMLYLPLQRLSSASAFYLGGGTGLWADTIPSLIGESLHKAAYKPWAEPLMMALVAIVLVASVVVIVRNGRQQSWELRQVHLLITTGLLCGIGLVIIVHHWLLDARFMIHRSALFLAPLFMVNLAWLVDHLRETRLGRQVAFTLIVTISAGWAVHTVITTSTDRFLSWGYDQHTRDAMVHIAEREIAQGTPIRLGTHWLFEPTANYYRHVLGLDQLRPITRDSLTLECDYLYVPLDDFTPAVAERYSALKTFPTTNTVLAVSKKIQ